MVLKGDCSRTRFDDVHNDGALRRSDFVKNFELFRVWSTSSSMSVFFDQVEHVDPWFFGGGTNVQMY